MRKIYPFKSIAVTFILCLFIIGQAAGQITTVAGRPTYLGNGNPAISAGLFSPYAMAVDTAGNLYIATVNDNQVRRIDAVTHIITTIAGTGASGFSGDHGPAISAKLNFDQSGLPGLTVDKKGNVFIGDYQNNRIRRIDASTGIITTIAGNGLSNYSGDGGQAVAAALSGPAGMTTDTAGNVYFADNNNSLIREVNIKTGVITTVAGSYANGGFYSGDNGLATNAGLSYPERVAFDKYGNLYISDAQNNVIRKVDHTTQIITTVAGNGNPGSTGDNGAATSAELNIPEGITVDSAGNIYIADEYNNKIRKVTASTGQISTIAGTGGFGYSGDNGPATSAALHYPSDVLVDKSGNVTILDANNNVIRFITATTGSISTEYGDGTTGFTGVQSNALKAQLAPQGVTFSPNGDMLIADGYYYDIRDVSVDGTYIYAGIPSPDPATASKGAAANNVSVTAAQFNAPFGIIADANNNVYVADVFNNVVRVINYNSKTVSNYAGNGTAGFSGDNGAASSAMLTTPYGIAIDGKGNLYIADAGNNRIRKVTASTQKITTIAGTATAGATGDGSAATLAELSFPNAVSVDTAGNVFILDRGNKSVRKITASTGIINTILSNGHIFSGIANDGAGNIFVSDSTSNTIVRIDRNDYTYQVVAGNGTAGFSGDNGPAVSAQLDGPKGLYLDSHNYIYVADMGNNVIRKIVMGTLPVALENFSAQKDKNTVTLQWSIATEQNKDYFDVEREGDNGTGWQVIGTVQGRGISSALQSYLFNDASPLSGNNYYRLKLVDGDGNFSYSSVLTVNFTVAWIVKTYPNPVKSNITLAFNNDNNEEATIIIYNAAGNIVLVKQQPVIKGLNQIVLSGLQPLAQGTYFIKLTTKTNSYQSKFVRAAE